MHPPPPPPPTAAAQPPLPRLDEPASSSSSSSSSSPCASRADLAPRPNPTTTDPRTHQGLAGVAADETAVSTVGKASLGLTYRGYAIEDLARQCAFEEVAFLLLHGALPTAPQLAAYRRHLAALRALPPALCEVLERIPGDAPPMDVLRSGCSVLGTLEPERGLAAAHTAAVGERLLAAFGSMLLYHHHYHRSGGAKRLAFNTDPEDGLATAFLKMLADDPAAPPDPLHVRVVNASLILYAEHDLAASTFAARVTASTLSDTFSAVCTGIGTLRGPLHGGANEAVQHFMEGLAGPEEAERVLLGKLGRKELVMGFGHRIYKGGDPRNRVFKAFSKELARRPDGQPRLFAVSERLEKVMAAKKNMHP